MGRAEEKRRKAAQAKKKAEKLAAKGIVQTEKVGEVETTGSNLATDEEVQAALRNPRTSTGVLASHPLSRDVKIDAFSLQAHGMELITECSLELTYGRRYGLLGLNGTGKSSMLQTIGNREIPIPDHIDIYMLDREAPPVEENPVQFIVAGVAKERERLEKLAEGMAADAEDENVARELTYIYERLDELDADTAEATAGKILHGLQFSKAMQEKACREFSGGWRMRVALAKALFVRPALLVLDEPTNHLDLEACVWLEEYLKKFDRILIMVSHSQDFLNAVCTNIVHLHQKKLTYYSGNFDSYVKARAENEENQLKRYEWEQAQIADMKEYIARFGHGSAKLARQAQSKEKTLAKMVEAGLTQKPAKEIQFSFVFQPCGKLPPPVLQFINVSFKYAKAESRLLYKDLDFGVDLDSRVALVGPNGAGKSTLLKLMVGDLVPINGMVKRHPHLRIARYHQHLAEQLDLELSPVDFMLKEFPHIKELSEMRKVVGRFGITGANQMQPISKLSDGQRSRVVFAWLSNKNPHMLLLDEPTNHLDIETIDSLADAINKWDGGMVLVSHDFRLIGQVAKSIWICDKQTVTEWKGTIQEYKARLREDVLGE